MDFIGSVGGSTGGGNVTNGDLHDHAGGDGAQIDHGGLNGLGDDDHTQYVKHALSTAANDVPVGSGSNTWIKKTLPEFQAIMEGAVTVLALPTATATPSLAGGTHFTATNLAAQDITNFTNGVVGQSYQIEFMNGNSTLIFNGSVNLFRWDGLDTDITMLTGYVAWVIILTDGTKSISWAVK